MTDALSWTARLLAKMLSLYSCKSYPEHMLSFFNNSPVHVVGSPLPPNSSPGTNSIYTLGFKPPEVRGGKARQRKIKASQVKASHVAPHLSV